MPDQAQKERRWKIYPDPNGYGTRVAPGPDLPPNGVEVMDVTEHEAALEELRGQRDAGYKEALTMKLLVDEWESRANQAEAELEKLRAGVREEIERLRAKAAVQRQIQDEECAKRHAGQSIHPPRHPEIRADAHRIAYEDAAVYLTALLSTQPEGDENPWPDEVYFTVPPKNLRRGRIGFAAEGDVGVGAGCKGRLSPGTPGMAPLPETKASSSRASADSSLDQEEAEGFRIPSAEAPLTFDPSDETRQRIRERNPTQPVSEQPEEKR